MIDPLSQIPVLDMFMGQGSDPASQVFQDLKRKAEEARAQAQAQNPGMPQPPIDYAGLMTKASQIAAGTPPEATLEPERIQEAARHVGGGGGEEPGPWGRLGRSFHGEEIPAEAARSARFQGLTDAGVALMGSASEGNLGRGLAEGMAAFQGGLDRELGGYSEQRRTREADELRRRQLEESMSASREGRERARAGEARDATSYEQSQEDRRSILESMRDQAQEILETAGADSMEAERARALMKGGPTLRDDLDKLHQQVIARERFPEDQAMETDAEIERKKRLFAEDPQARYDRGLDERRLAVYADRAGRSSGGTVTPTAYLSEVGREIGRRYDALIKANSSGGKYLKPGVDPKKLLEQAEEEATEAVAARMRGLGGSSPASGDNGESGGGGTDIDAQLRDLENRARMLGAPLDDEDLRLIRRDLEAGVSAQKILDRISGGR